MSSLIEKTRVALLAISMLRLKSNNEEIVEQESARLERIFEEHWIKNVNDMDYFESLIDWLKLNKHALLIPENYQGDYLVGSRISEMRTSSSGSHALRIPDFHEAYKHGGME